MVPWSWGGGGLWHDQSWRHQVAGTGTHRGSLHLRGRLPCDPYTCPRTTMNGN
ncbi:hypothetical protein F751_4589 [Auxenochlorella protothecoides]|uniref:Uncharacterized protein n=1 Tax=Auxenochlorella protothecoides TaxID=3075 RepID=A0A087SNL5_AUXPR|nr:hypothetical protein F751_4589 [Auxenochlorella protothecoides]KFM27319.1 hypothetical protein F751_4589 [Auxenochlorella protothecoides]